ncbi:hypothetical protein L1887_51396 [Cichorium endivia]|nr:hypothetical protein L1887_51396 [Cichorium endivia]
MKWYARSSPVSMTGKSTSSTRFRDRPSFRHGRSRSHPASGSTERFRCSEAETLFGPLGRGGVFELVVEPAEVLARLALVVLERLLPLCSRQALRLLQLCLLDDPVNAGPPTLVGAAARRRLGRRPESYLAHLAHCLVGSSGTLEGRSANGFDLPHCACSRQERRSALHASSRVEAHPLETVRKCRGGVHARSELACIHGRPGRVHRHAAKEKRIQNRLHPCSPSHGATPKPAQPLSAAAAYAANLPIAPAIVCDHPTELDHSRARHLLKKTSYPCIPARLQCRVRAFGSSDTVHTFASLLPR